MSLVQKSEVNKWADEPGPLKLVAIDTGGGKLLLREDVSDYPTDPCEKQSGAVALLQCRLLLSFAPVPMLSLLWRLNAGTVR